MYSAHQLNSVHLSKTALINNYYYLQSLSSRIAIAPVLKSNAYGHGILEVAKMLDTLNAPFYCVNSFDEAITLYKNGITTPIHIMGFVAPENIRLGLPFTYTLCNFDQVQLLNKVYKNASVHVFLDTGMHREGFLIDQLPQLVKIIKTCSNISINGIMSHLATGDNPRSDITKKQIASFLHGIAYFKQHDIIPRWHHILASSGLLSHYEIGSFYGNLARTGKALFGIDPRGQNKNLEPILSLQSKIVQIKKLPKNEPIGYDATFHTSQNILIALIPVGYSDGVDRRLSNKGYVVIDGVTCPIIGRISMNMTTIDITSVKNPYVGMDVLVFSNNQNDLNSIQANALCCDTIPYDIATGISNTLARKIF